MLYDKTFPFFSKMDRCFLLARSVFLKFEKFHDIALSLVWVLEKFLFLISLKITASVSPKKIKKKGIVYNESKFLSANRILLLSI